MPRDRRSLKALTLRGSGWTIVGHGAGALLRLGSNLILTRLLFREAFGLMSLVWVVMFGLEMLSDVGVGPAIIQNERGDDPDMLNTAWTLRVIRGWLLWVVACVVAGPMASFYGEPALAELIVVAALIGPISGFASTAIYTCQRHMEFGRITLLELFNQIVAFAVVVLWAFLSPTVWALVGGALVGRAFYVIMSHVMLPGIRNRFRWDRSASRVLVAFGKWILLSSTFHFLAVQSDRILLGYYLDMSQLGVYSIAILLTDAVLKLAIKVNHGVLFPAYGRVVHGDSELLRSVCYRARLGIDVLFIVPTASLMILGTWLVGVLYDDRWQEAGWMVQVLCVRVLMGCVLSNGEACLVALGRPQYSFSQSLCRAAWILVSIPLGWSVAGLTGVVWAVALSEVPVMVVLWAGLIRHRMLSIAGELRSVLAAGTGALLGFGLLQVLQ